VHAEWPHGPETGRIVIKLMRGKEDIKVGQRAQDGDCYQEDSGHVCSPVRIVDQQSIS